MVRDLNHEGVRSFMIVLKNKGDVVKKEKVTLEYHELDDGMIKHADPLMDCDKSFKKHDLDGPLLYELHRTEEHKYFVETSKRFGMIHYHANMQLLTRSY